MTTLTIGTRQRVVKRLCAVLERNSNAVMPKSILSRLNEVVAGLNEQAGISPNSSKSDTSIVGGEVMTMLYSPNFSPAFRMNIQESHNGGDNDQYSVVELLESYLDPLGSNYGELSEDSHDFKVLNNIKEDYIILS